MKRIAKDKTVTRAEVRAWSAHSMPSASIQNADDEDEGDLSSQAWDWIHGDDEAEPVRSGLGAGAFVIAGSTHTGGEWVRVTS